MLLYGLNYEEYEKELGRPLTEREKKFVEKVYIEATTAIERHKADQIINAIMGKETEDNFTITITIKEDEL